MEVWAKPLVSTISGEVAVGLLNRSKKATAISFNLESVGLDATASYTMRDLWSKKDFPASTNNKISFEVPAHGIVVLNIKGKALPYNVFQYKSKEI